MALSDQAIAVLQTVTDNENKQALAKHLSDVQTYLSVTAQDWIATNVQSRNLLNNVGFTPTPIPAKPTLTTYQLNTDTGEITSTQVTDSSIPDPVLPPFVSAGGNAFATLQPNLNSQEMDLNTVTLQSLSAKLDRVINFFKIP